MPKTTSKKSRVVSPKAQGQKMRLMMITPGMATKWLKRNVNYRRASNMRVNRFAGILQEGQMHVTGDTIKFNEDGDLIDGQKRLMACEATGISFKSWVCWGVKSHLGIDENEPRKPADEMRYRGFANAIHLASACRTVLLYEHNNIGEEGRHTGRSSYSIQQVADVTLRHKNLPDFVAAARSNNHHIPTSQIAAIVYIGSEGDLDNPLAVSFLDGLHTGLNLEEGNPVHTLREAFVRFAIKGIKPTSRGVKAYIINAWNAHVKGEKLSFRKIAWVEGGPRRMEFPRILLAPKAKKE